MFHKILFAADGSEHSIRAGEKAFELASYNKDSKVDILYVVDPKQSKGEVLNNWGKDTNVIRKEKLELIVQKAKHSKTNFEVVFLHGDPGPTIVDYANKNKMDIVVIGSRGLNAFQEMVLGSVSHKVAKRANCPVMIIK
ncbi:universal stress protein [Ornithinibacillus halophilus]|uniref:Nucleotide-binding universal stress protein, UspA family n=1 Tax=Ornithinibacillus halophilus TaxID=930117 RepID=A0A1M5DVS8_9BACI|nr:universal stress protein [Ornithinibacillus halophilus]SHF70964.1 Nucleotide-binding universal stress protein, UspA family [Ornithinibacillus halophilus]